MGNLELRPLSIGELLDRTFTLYRRNFLLFIGIAAIPQLLVLGLQLAQLMFLETPRTMNVPVTTELQAASGISSAGIVGVLVGAIVGIVVYLVAYLFSQGGSVYAVSEIYLGRPTTIGQSLSRMKGELGSLFGVVFLNGLVTGLCFLLLVIPGIYMACRLCVCIPAALLENLGPRDSLERSFRLTKDNAGRAFLILLLYAFILYAMLLLVDVPFFAAVASAGRNARLVRTWMELMQVGNFVGTVLVTPVFTIATSILYFDLRVRKEAFDLQMMMNPAAVGVPAPPSSGSLLS